MRLLLARLYRKQGKDGLAKIELAQLERDDLGGDLLLFSRLR